MSREKSLDQMTEEEIASVDCDIEGDQHPTHVPDMIASEDGVIGENIPDEAYDSDGESGQGKES